jgi:von Hippel-Lindau disease tumor supressor
MAIPIGPRQNHRIDDGQFVIDRSVSFIGLISLSFATRSGNAPVPLPMVDSLQRPYFLGETLMFGARNPFLLILTTLILSAPTAALAKHPAEVKGVRSQVGGESVQTAIKFVNGSSSVIKVYWLDYKGKRVLYGTLKPSENLPIDTYLTHPWLITDGDDNAKSIYFPDGQPRTVEITN